MRQHTQQKKAQNWPTLSSGPHPAGMMALCETWRTPGKELPVCQIWATSEPRQYSASKVARGGFVLIGPYSPFTIWATLDPYFWGGYLGRICYFPGRQLEAHICSLSGPQGNQRGRIRMLSENSATIICGDSYIFRFYQKVKCL